MREDNIKDIPRLYMMIGISGSGKSTYAKKIAEYDNCVIVSSDGIRAELFNGKPYDSSRNGEVFNIFNKRIKDALKSGKNCIADATSITVKSRRSIISNLVKVDYTLVGIVLTTPVSICRYWNDNTDRDHFVPADVISRQIRSFQIPFYNEGFDKILFYKPEDILTKSHPSLNFLIDNMKNLDQENPHHTMNLFDHSIYTLQKLLDSGVSLKSGQKYGTFLHDIGKIYTKAYDENQIAHYYNHENVGTYMLLSYIPKGFPSEFNEDILNLLFIVNYHMIPFNWLKDQNANSRDRWRNIFGEDNYNFLLKFNECDIAR